jgi:hypothetical protein
MKKRVAISVLHARESLVERFEHSLHPP